MLRTLIFLLIFRATNAGWGKNVCPSSCNCQMSELRDDLLATSWNPDQDTAKVVHPNEAIHLSDQKSINFHDVLKTAVCVYRSDVGIDEWMHQLPSDIEALTIMQAPGGEKMVFEEKHFQPFAFLTLLDIQGAVNATQIVLKSNSLRPLRSLQFLSLRNIRFQGQPETAPTHHPTYSLQDLPADITQWKNQQPAEPPHEIVFLTEVDPLPYPVYKAAVEYADMSIFNGLERLRVLRVDSCGIKEIKWQMFQGLRSLEWLSLERNEMMFIPDFAFYGAPHLKHLSLAHNRILSMHFTNLAGLLELERLDLSYNNLPHLSELSLPPFPQLLEVDFRSNPIEAVYKSTFEVINRTESLYLGGETPLSLQESGLSGLDSLRSLVITNAKAEVLDLSTLKGARRLRKLRIQGQIDEIAYDAFSAATKLEQLVLKDCKIKTISMDAFYGLFGLSVLDLSDNQLTSLPPKIFDQLTSLKELQLQNNQFTTLPEDIFIKLSAKMIRLDGNPWHCTCEMREWRPMSVNKVKMQVDRTIQVSDAKGAPEVTVQGTQYRFEKKVAPKCKTPEKYENWSVFHVLRKELRCTLSDIKKEIIEKRRFVVKKGYWVKKNQVEGLVSETSKAEISKLDKVTVASTTARSVETTKLKEISNKISNELPEEQVAKIDAEPENELSPIPKEDNNLMAILHDGKMVKISKKAHKLEMERKRQEKLKRLAQLENSH
ncbi:insulin-like growth factor-binding protein complex acid labile subunit [Neocloeon triangulifer]|uniref:insulin-like growth factor-binding protein complex acid labile subunit n=1 Tax=Neocloeon triangulifer TaxID=2078957 RepID=UPI00286EE99B|nr:insulin-like growth factor-binding protein complex acid labile subunit [Neocloeon triangulifer]